MLISKLLSRKAVPIHTGSATPTHHKASWFKKEKSLLEPKEHMHLADLTCVSFLTTEVNFFLIQKLCYLF